MLTNATVVEFMIAVTFIVIFSISFGMEIHNPKAKPHINRWLKKMIAKLLVGDEEDD